MANQHVERKEDHIRIVLDRPSSISGVTTGLENVRFSHCALPELALGEIDLSSTFVGRRISAPIMVSSMTGGPARTAEINHNIAAACQALGLPFGVGSQRVALEHGTIAGLGPELRRIAPDVPILGNLGAAQLCADDALDKARKAVEMIEADALFIHLNPLQEAVQPEGDRDWRGLFDRIVMLAEKLEVPLAVKEVGFGLSGALCGRLHEAGIGILDVAGAGGTNWARVEAARATPERQGLGATFADWGIPTAEAIRRARAAAPDATIIGSGGLASGLDVARAIRLGADLGGIAAGVLKDAIASQSELESRLSTVVEELRITCFCTASRDLEALRTAELLSDRGALDS